MGEWLQSVVVPKIRDSQAQLLDPYMWVSDVLNDVMCVCVYGPAARSLRVSDVLNYVMCELYVLTASRYVNHSSFTDEPELQNLNPG